MGSGVVRSGRAPGVSAGPRGCGRSPAPVPSGRREVPAVQGADLLLTIAEVAVAFAGFASVVVVAALLRNASGVLLHRAFGAYRG